MKKGHLLILKELLNRPDEEKNPVIYEYSIGVNVTVLHVAAYYGHVNIIKWYQNYLHFDDINPLDESGLYSPMLFAAQRGMFPVVEYYLSAVEERVWNKRSDTKYIFDKGRVPLHRAAQYGRDDVLKLLLTNVTDKMPRDAVGRTPLHFSAMTDEGHFNVTKYLLDSVSNSSLINQHAFNEDKYWTPLHWAASKGHKGIVELILTRVIGSKNPKNKPGKEVQIVNTLAAHLRALMETQDFFSKGYST